MGICRFLYDNLITSSTMITVSSLKNGVMTGSLKEGLGSASLNVSGAFTGAEDLEYIVEIDSTAAGNEVAQASFKWSDGGGGWDGTTVVTSSSNISLNNGVLVNWTSGAGNDFELADKWYFKGYNLFNASKMLDGNRNSRYRSAGLTTADTIIIDLGSAQQIKSAIIYDHNFTSSVSVSLQGATSASFVGGITTSLTFNSEKILHHLSSAETYRYWKIIVNDNANPAGYFEVGELFLGSYFEPSGNFGLGSNRPIDFVENTRYTQYGVRKSRFANLCKKLELNFPKMKSTDCDNFETLLTGITNQDSGLQKPIYFNEDSTLANDILMMNLVNYTKNKPLNLWFDIGVKLEEVMKTV